MIFGPEEGSAEQRAFQAKIGQFVERIDLAQFAVELQAIENRDRIVETNMLGPKIAVAVDDVLQTRALLEKRPISSSAVRLSDREGLECAHDQARNHGG